MRRNSALRRVSWRLRLEGAGVVAEVPVDDGGANSSAAGFGLFVDLGLLASHLDIHGAGSCGTGICGVPEARVTWVRARD